MDKKKFLICQYSHIEGYPPTFNAINVLAQEGHNIVVLCRKDLETKWKYAKNVKLNFIGNYKNRFEFEKTSKLHKIREFLKYVSTLKKLIKNEKPDIVLLYDNIPLMAYRLIRSFVSKRHKVWYHNHDVELQSSYKKYSLNYFACFVERKAFKFIDIFSLPADERKPFFNLSKFIGKYFLIPNYPPKYLFDNNFKKKKKKDEIKLVYPGNISNMHGFEEIVAILGIENFSTPVSLYLIGDISLKYKGELLLIAENSKTKNYLHLVSRISYLEMSKEIAKYDIGIAINKPLCITYETGGTAANKTYEYAACGLPILSLDTEHYRKHLEKYEWAFFTDLSEKSLVEQIQNIIQDYDKYVEAAKKDFNDDLFFEKHFLNVVQKILNEL